MSETVNVRVLLFAKARELSGVSETTLEVPKVIKGGELFEKLCESFQLKAIRDNLILSLNGDFCDEFDVTFTLKDTDELALIPPLSGG